LFVNCENIWHRHNTTEASAPVGERQVSERPMSNAFHPVDGATRARSNVINSRAKHRSRDISPKKPFFFSVFSFVSCELRHTTGNPFPAWSRECQRKNIPKAGKKQTIEDLSDLGSSQSRGFSSCTIFCLSAVTHENLPSSVSCSLELFAGKFLC
jgi:hypothetical protein